VPNLPIRREGDKVRGGMPKACRGKVGALIIAASI